VSTKTVIKRELYTPLIKLVIGLIILAIIYEILIHIPMIYGLWIPNVPIGATAIISVIVGIIMISLFLTFQRSFIPPFKATFPSFPEGERIISSAVIVCILIIAYTMFGGIILPFMTGFSWVYSLVFLLIAIVPIYTLIITLYRSGGRLSELLGTKVAEATGELIKCPKCGETVSSDTKFCTKCGAALSTTVMSPTPTTTIKCRECGAENKSINKFCSNCGKPIEKGEDKI
jgi:DNA-directed RNA polymerase subunit RPC12/RpoP